MLKMCADRPAPSRSESAAATTQQTMTIDDIREAILSLSDASRREMLESLGFKSEHEIIVTIYDGQQNLDDPDPEEVEQEDESQSDPLRARASDIDRPRAVVVFGSHCNRERQEIDILASVRKDATNISHPAILAAIRFWQGSVICRRKLPQLNAEYGARLIRSGEIAERHLRKLGDCLLDSARDNAWSAAYAFDFYRRTTFDRNYYLELVFKVYRENWSHNVRAQVNVDELIKKVRTRLSQDEYVNGALRTALNEDALKILEPGFEQVRQFLSSEIGKWVFKRRQWKHWQNRFDEWRFHLGEDVQRRYRNSMKKSTEILLNGAEGLLQDERTGDTLGPPVAPYPDRNWYTMPATTTALDLPVVLFK